MYTRRQMKGQQLSLAGLLQLIALLCDATKNITIVSNDSQMTNDYSPKIWLQKYGSSIPHNYARPVDNIW